MARLTPPIPPAGVALSDAPTIRGRKAAHRWLNDVLGVPVSLNYVHQGVKNHQIPGAAKMSGAVFFSTRGLFDWIMTCYDEAAS